MISSSRLAQNIKGSYFYKTKKKKRKKKKRKKKLSDVKYGQIWLNDFLDDHHFWLYLKNPSNKMNTAHSLIHQSLFFWKISFRVHL